MSCHRRSTLMSSALASHAICASLTNVRCATRSQNCVCAASSALSSLLSSRKMKSMKKSLSKLDECVCVCVCVCVCMCVAHIVTCHTSTCHANHSTAFQHVTSTATYRASPTAPSNSSLEKRQLPGVMKPLWKPCDRWMQHADMCLGCMMMHSTNAVHTHQLHVTYKSQHRHSFHILGQMSHAYEYISIEW